MRDTRCKWGRDGEREREKKRRRKKESETVPELGGKLGREDQATTRKREIQGRRKGSREKEVEEEERE